jgi:hypothetical protein
VQLLGAALRIRVPDRGRRKGERADGDENHNCERDDNALHLLLPF